LFVVDHVEKVASDRGEENNKGGKEGEVEEEGLSLGLGSKRGPGMAHSRTGREGGGSAGYGKNDNPTRTGNP